MPLFPIALIQSLLLCAGQVLVKLALSRIDRFEWSWRFVSSQLTNWWWLLCGISFVSAGVLWAYILRHYPFSQAYPLSSMAYVFGLLAAWLLFGEAIRPTTCLGILLIMAGCYLVAR